MNELNINLGKLAISSEIKSIKVEVVPRPEVLIEED
jgi:hypothetical protein